MSKRKLNNLGILEQIQYVYDIARKNKGGDGTVPTKTSDLENDSNFITSSDLPTVGDGTITIRQGGSSKGTFTTNQSGNTTIDLSEGLESVDWSNIENKPNFSSVATSGSYTDLTNKPTLFSGKYSDLTGKPTIPSKTSELTNDSNFVDTTALATKANLTHSHSYNDLENKPILFSGKYADLTGKPTIPTKTSDLTNDSGFSTFSGSYNDLTNKPTIYTEFKTISGDSILGSGDLLPKSVRNQRNSGGIKFWTGTQAEYADIVLPDPDTLYFIKD